MTVNKNSVRTEDRNKREILLVLMPFWTPLIPPMGIICLKNFLQKFGYNVKAVDLNVDDVVRESYNRYFTYLEEVIPENKRSNFFSVGQDVLRYHMLAAVNYKEEVEYLNFLKTLVFKNFYVDVNEHQLNELNHIVLELFNRLENRLLELLKKEEPDLMGISVFKGTIAAALFGFRLVKKNFPHIKTVMGGGVFADQLAVGSPNLNFFLEKTKDYIDKIIIGEGEQLFLKLLQNELPDSQRVFTLKDNDNKFLDISSPGITDITDFNLEYYPYLPYYASRGCPYNCSFCSETIRWGKYRKKNLEKVAAEIITLGDRYSSQLFLLTDSLLNPIIDDFSKELVAANASIYWDGYLRADKGIDNIERTLLWRKGGFYRARLGIESGSPHVLELMKKKITPGQIRQTLSNMAYAGIKTSTLWVIGHPGETEEDFRLTLELIEKCKDYIYDAEGTPFWYYLTGQVNSNQWSKKGKLLFPDIHADMLIVREWIMDGQPSREVAYARLNRFVEHCNKLGIPNSYSLNDIYNADQRWKKLHKNAVPPLSEFSKKNYIDENKNVTKLSYIKNQIWEESEFSF
jgi:hypothetical protein